LLVVVVVVYILEERKELGREIAERGMKRGGLCCAYVFDWSIGKVFLILFPKVRPMLLLLCTGWGPLLLIFSFE
jgi:hypothetical protein